MVSFGSSVDTIDISIEFLSKIAYVEKSKISTVDVGIRITNNSKKNFLLYNFRTEPDQAFFEESFYCNEEIAARPSIIIYDHNMEQIHSRPRIPAEINYKPITEEIIEEVISMEKSKFRNALQVVSAKSSVEIPLTVNLNQFPLEPGSYFMKLVYSSGTYSFNMIGQDQVDDDKSKYDSDMFSGCVSSNMIKLVVN
ncbi:MAG: hypothetical protein EBR30_29665 [Cytophagia bacterium]|nr:hypothetical protein [Cytophagia bacterium]NBW39113.1 hypothetical protein [Cytophagia bacterium]